MTGDGCGSNVVFDCKTKLRNRFHDDDSDVHTEITPVI